MPNRNLHQIIDPKSADGSNSGNRLRLVSKTNMLLLIAGLFCALAIGFFWYKSDHATTITEQNEGEVFVDLDEIITNLNNDGGNANYLKLRLVLAVDDVQSAALLKARTPAINDALNIFLRELRISDITGSGGALMIKSEILKRVNKVSQPIVVKDVLFKEFIIN